MRHATYLGYKVVLIRDAHSTFNSTVLTAPQIIAHENNVLGNNFADFKVQMKLILINILTFL